MAAVDLYGSDASQIRNAYKSNLGRDASDDEVSNWLSGAYGGSDLGGRLNQIATSGEAQQFRQAQTPTVGQNPNVNTTMPVTPYQNLDYWKDQNVNYGDIFNTNTGQLNSGWARTASGYERTAPQTHGPQGGNYQAWFQQLTGGRAPTPESLEALAPTLAQYGIRLGSKGNRGWTDTIILPDGRTYDVIEAAGIGTGKGWTFSQNGGPGYQPTAGVADQYSDPYTQLLEQLLKGRIGSLGQPMNDPFRDQYMAAMQRRTSALNAAEPDYQRLRASMEGRITDLRGPGYTGAENEAVRTQALDPIEADRTAAKKRVSEQLAARGFDPQSGVFQEAMRNVDNAFDGMRATTQTTLTTNDLQRREGRQSRADTMEGALYDVGQQRSREQLDTFGAIDALSALMRSEEDARGREQISLGGALADLGPQRLQLAMQAAGMGGNPTSNFSSLLGLANLNQNAALLNQRNSGQLWSGLGSIAAILRERGAVA